MSRIGKSAVRVRGRDARVFRAEGDDRPAQVPEVAHQGQALGDQRDVLRQLSRLRGLPLTTLRAHNVPLESRIA